MNEDEIAADYPLPAYYKPTSDETDEYTIFDDLCMYDADQLPRNMLHNWSLYNSDSRLVSVELLPMKPCGEIDFAIFGSGIMTEDIGSGFCYDDDSIQSSTSTELENVDGIPVYLSEIILNFELLWSLYQSELIWPGNVSLLLSDFVYRLGKPSKQYAPWYETVLRTARLSISIITLLKEQSRVARFSVKEVLKRLSEFEKCHPAFISSNPIAVERYVVVHGQIILQQFAEYPDNNIRRCPFVSGLQTKIEERHHTKCLVKKKAVTKKGFNLNPRAAMVPIKKKQLLPATSTKLINRIWGEFYSNYSPEDSKNTFVSESKEEPLEEQDEDAEEEFEEQDDDIPVMETVKSHQHGRRDKLQCSAQDIKWVDESTQNTSANEALYKKADVLGDFVVVGGCVIVETTDSEDLLPIYFVEYMYEKSDGRKMAHGRLMLRGFQTVLGNVTDEREVFLTNNCLDFDLKEVKESVVVEIRSLPWGYQHRKNNADSEKMDRARADERKSKGLPMEYYVRSFYCPENGAFLALPSDAMGIGNGICHACKTKKTEKDINTLKVNSCNTGFMYLGTEYNLLDFVYVAHRQFEDEKESEKFKGGRNVDLKPCIIFQLLGIDTPKGSRQVTPQSVKIKARRFFRSDDISEEKAYRSHIYVSEKVHVLTVTAIQGKCDVKKKSDFLSSGYSFIHEHVFFCGLLYDPDSGALKQLPTSLKLSSSNEKPFDYSASRKNKGKIKEGETEGVSLTKWAIEYEEPAGQAFNLNHPKTMGFSGMNRFSKGAWSKVQCEMILAFLSFVDYFRPIYFLLENVRNFISFNKGQTFRLTIASLLEMGYQVRFGILEAGAFGVSQSRKRAFIWAASPQETLPEWPEPVHVFAGSELKVSLDSNRQYAAVRSSASGAPFRSITVRDTICDLPDVRNGASITPMEYKNDSVS
uniref:DNA (cytosine-5-)-methyltransferase n=1 Tax=Chenopodium quinoa TaxID=63459 RepID=A0A803LZ07_CHEQI